MAHGSTGTPLLGEWIAIVQIAVVIAAILYTLAAEARKSDCIAECGLRANLLCSSFQQYMADYDARFSARAQRGAGR